MGYLVLAVIAASLFYPALFIGQAHAQSSGQLFTVDLLCPIGNPARQQWCSIIQKSLQQVGINAQLTYAPFSTLIAHLLGPQSTWNESFSQGGYDIAFIGLYNSNPLINPARWLYGSLSTFPPGINFEHFNNSQENQLALQFVSQPGGNWTAWAQFYENEAKILPAIPVAYPDAFDLVAPQVHGMSPKWQSVDLQAQYLTGMSSVVLAVPDTIPDTSATPNYFGGSVYYDQEYSYQIYSPLIALNPSTAQLVPSIATNWSTPDGGHTWYITIRNNARFSDGEPVTVNDVIYSIWSNMNPEFASATYGEWIDVLGTNVTFTWLNGTTTVLDNPPTYQICYPQVKYTSGSVTAINSTTIKIQLGFCGGRAYGIFPEEELTGLFIVPMHIWESVPPSELKSSPMITGTGSITVTLPNGTVETVYGPVGSGPYMWTQNSFDKTADAITLVKNPFFWNATALESQGLYQVNQFTVQGILQKDTAIADLKSGSVQIVDFNYYPTIERASGEFTNQPWVKIVDYGPGFGGWQIMAFNMYNPIFGTGVATPLGERDPAMAAQAAQDVREAIAYLIPYTEIINGLLAGYGAYGSAYTSPAYLGWNLIANNIPVYSYNVGEALSLLAAAGYTVSYTSGLQLSGPSHVNPGQTISLNGKFYNATSGQPFSGMSVEIQESTDNQTWSTLANVTTTSSGTFSYNASESSQGAYYFRAYFPGRIEPLTKNTSVTAQALPPYTSNSVEVTVGQVTTPPTTTSTSTTTTSSTVIIAVVVVVIVIILAAVLAMRRRR